MTNVPYAQAVGAFFYASIVTKLDLIYAIAEVSLHNVRLLIELVGMQSNKHFVMLKRYYHGVNLNHKV